jgi:hypothetical protein
LFKRARFRERVSPKESLLRIGELFIQYAIKAIAITRGKSIVITGKACPLPVTLIF